MLLLSYIWWGLRVRGWMVFVPMPEFFIGGLLGLVDLGFDFLFVAR